uniref:Uncharacterized protein n=1 Tax=Anguilla anguilla TaxID=7936 RepID=A0A0E9P5H8_ANGAN
MTNKHCRLCRIFQNSVGTCFVKLKCHSLNTMHTPKGIYKGILTINVTE